MHFSEGRGEEDGIMVGFRGQREICMFIERENQEKGERWKKIKMEGRIVELPSNSLTMH